MKVRPIQRETGYTLAELVMVCAILVILAALILPLSRVTVTRGKEADLRHSLRELRNAIDEYKRYSDAQLIDIDLGTDGYPSALEDLVEGKEITGQIGKQIRFLRRLPVDPMTGDTEWGLRSQQDEPDSTSWGGENVFDVYSLSDGVGLNGTPYREW